MSENPLNRREFLRRAAVVGATGGLTALNGCGGGSTRPETPPSAPTGLTARAAGATRIDLSWTDTSADETGFELERRAAAAGDFAPLVEIPADTTSYSDTTAVESTMYQYRVRAVRGTEASAYSNDATVQTPAAGAPVAPADLTAFAVTTSTVRLSWTDASDNEAGFRVLVRDTSGQVSLLATLDPGTTEHVVEGLAQGTLHHLFVEAFNDGGVSAESNEVGVFTDPLVSGLTVVVTAPSAVRLDWTDETAGAVSFRIERRLDGGAFSEAGRTAAGATSFTDGSLPAADHYAWRITGVDVSGVDTDPATLDVPAEAPAPPGDLHVVQDGADGSRLLCTWTAGGADGFELGRSNGGAFSIIGSPADAAFTDAPTPLLPFTYRVRAFNLRGYSGYSPTAAARARLVVRFDALPAAQDLRVVGRGTRVTVSAVPPRTFSPALAGCGAAPTYIHLVRTTADTIAAVQGNCTHQCCTTNYVPNAASPADGKFTCPCHGSQFRLDGSIINGPAGAPEPAFPTVLFQDRVEVLAPGTSGVERRERT